jgi:glycosyltransferase involved in cell wall biosynthesis
MKLAIVTPNFNDWDSVDVLLAELNEEAASLDAAVDVYIVDDGSTKPRQKPWQVLNLATLREIVLIELACNQGHQRAIALGLTHVSNRGTYDAVMVMDCDGEDRPEELALLLRVHAKHPHKIVVAQRAERSEGKVFVTLYWIYKQAFTFMTGQYIDFGNFSLMPAPALARLVYMPELWNHLAASILHSKLPIERVATVRGKRYAGHSSMNFISLVAHGLSGMSAFSEKLFVRLFTKSLYAAFIAAVIASVATGLRLFSDLAIPGWATTVVGFSAVVVLQALTLSAVAVFMSLSNRTALLFIPAINGPSLIKSATPVRALAERNAPNASTADVPSMVPA